MNQEFLAKCSCAHCGTHLEFAVEGAGTVVHCPHCGGATELTLTAPAPDAGRVSAAELMAEFGGPVPRTRVSLFYQAGLVLVTAMMVVLPLVYVAMVGAAAWGVYAYATHCSFLLAPSQTSGRVYLVKLLAYFIPLFAGSALVLFMIKPLFAGRAPRAQPLAMNPALEPTLYGFIARICDCVGAPMPKRIDLDCQLNASAGFRRGGASLLSNDLVLTIGLPLVAGLNLREFAGVVAHEFGHFTQGFGMRLSYVVRSINGWFARVVFERDAWDVWLERWSMEAEDWRVMLVVGCTRLAVGFSRFLLLLLMLVAHVVSCFLLRQMEYDADSYEIKVAGSATFEATARRLAVLSEALGKAYTEMRATWNLSKRLPDNLPQFLALQETKLPAAQRERINDTLGLSRTGLFHTHPSDGDRIRRGARRASPAFFTGKSLRPFCFRISTSWPNRSRSCITRRIWG